MAEPGQVDGRQLRADHRSKAGAALGSWALAFSADPDAQGYLDRALANMNRVWRYVFTKDGIHRDGAGYYWIFTIINSTPFLWQYRNVSGVDLFPGAAAGVRVAAQDHQPEGPDTPECGDGTGPPAAPAAVTSLAAERDDGGDVALAWSGSRLADSYTVLRDGAVVATGVTATTWTGPAPGGESAEYVVVATNPVGDSPPSDPASA